jgi:hypothetical protein
LISCGIVCANRPRTLAIASRGASSTHLEAIGRDAAIVAFTSVEYDNSGRALGLGHGANQNVHLPEIVSAKGFKSAQRYRLTTTLQGNAYPYLTIYEIETDDIGKSLADIGNRATTMSDAIDIQGAYACIYEVCDVPVEHGEAVKR